ncbi:MAG: rod shape-determining protein MreD [Cyanobacteriota bacterium]|nr:rod shape-determining protein MreD [Cyanobacteriota bacterium]
MALLSRHPLLATSLLLVPLLVLAAPPWLTLAGVPPCWAVLWVLPWALADGRRSALLLAAALGLLLDALHPGPVSWLPGLLGLAWWWGPLSTRQPPVGRPFSLGLLALVGTALLNLSLALQWLAWGWRPPLGSLAGGGNTAELAHPGWTWQDLSTAGLHLVLAQTLLTALLAPLLCPAQLKLWRRLHPNWRG